MGARKKLNEIHAIVALVIAAVLGLATSSWIAFGGTLAVLLAPRCIPAPFALVRGSLKGAGRRRFAKSFAVRSTN